MNIKKRKYLIVSILVIIIFALTIIIVINNANSNSKNIMTGFSEKYSQGNNVTVVNAVEENSNENIITDFLEKYSQASNAVVANFAGENITEKDIAYYEAFSGKKTDVLNTIIEDKIILKSAEENDTILTESDYKTIDDYRRQLERSDIYSTEEFKNSGLTKAEFIEIKVNDFTNIALKTRYKYNIIQKLYDKTFKTDKESINRKINEFNKVYDEWINSDKTDFKSFGKVLNLEDEITKEYFNYIIEKEKTNF